jgi:hypothetical protein
LTQQQDEKQQWQRTTIYVPFEIKQELQTYPSPSKELHRRFSAMKELEKIHDPFFSEVKNSESKKVRAKINDQSRHQSYMLHLEKHHYLGLKLLKQMGRY